MLFINRKPGSSRDGGSFSGVTVQAVWNKAQIVPGYDSSAWRKDQCGAWMAWAAYGKTNSQYGWEIDHIRPVAHGGGDELSNLQALQWENNRHKADSYPKWYCKIRA